MGTSLIHLFCEEISWIHFITSRERVKCHTHFPHVYHVLHYTLLTCLAQGEKRLHWGGTVYFV